MNEYTCSNCGGTGAVPCEPRELTFGDPESGLETVTYTVGMCPRCMGTGRLIDCLQCNGNGDLTYMGLPQAMAIGAPRSSRGPCFACHGSGKTAKPLPEIHRAEKGEPQ